MLTKYGLTKEKRDKIVDLGFNFEKICEDWNIDSSDENVWEILRGLKKFGGELKVEGVSLWGFPILRLSIYGKSWALEWILFSRIGFK